MHALAACRSLTRAAEKMAVLQANQLRSFGLTRPQFRVLEALLHSGPLGQTKLSDRLCCVPSAMSFLAKKLIELGLVAQRGNERDKRGKMNHLTPEGRRLISKVFLMHAALVRAQMSVLKGLEQDALFRLCEKLAAGDPVNFLRETMWGDAGEPSEGEA